VVRHERIRTNNIELNVALAGPEDGPLVVLLHGFPEFWYAWRKTIPALAAKGFRVAVPDQRGYNESDRPPGVRAYVLDELAKDVVGLISALGRRDACIVGHDWGAAVAWWLAMRFSASVSRLVILDVPHPLVMRRFLISDPAQLARSWYMGFFQLPALPEKVIAANDFAMFAEKAFGIARPGTFTAEEIEEYKHAWRKPGAMTAMLHWYRAIRYVIRDQPTAEEVRIRMPALVIWGEDDAQVPVDMAAPSVGFCDHGRLEVIENATHWVQHEEPERVNALILQHLGR
jgi:pimeloyl-ACP methyl ester carboxylesterase